MNKIYPYLTRNLIELIEPLCFSFCQILRILNLEANKIIYLNFNDIPIRVTRVFLGNNRIDDIDSVIEFSRA